MPGRSADRRACPPSVADFPVSCAPFSPHVRSISVDPQPPFASHLKPIQSRPPSPRTCSVQAGGGLTRTLHGWQRDRPEASPPPEPSGSSSGRLLLRRYIPKPHANRPDRACTRSSARSLLRLLLNDGWNWNGPVINHHMNPGVASSAPELLHRRHTFSPAPDSPSGAVGGGADLRLVGLEVTYYSKRTQNHVFCNGF